MKKIGLQLALKCQNSKLRVRTKTCSPRNSSRGFNSSSGKTTNHPLHLHQRILLVQQHERCSLRRWWFLGNPPPPNKKPREWQRDRRKPRVLGFESSVLQVDRGSQPLTLLRFSFTDWRNGQVEGDSWRKGPPTFCCYILSGDMEQIPKSFQWPKLLTESSPSKWKCKNFMVPA